MLLYEFYFSIATQKLPILKRDVLKRNLTLRKQVGPKTFTATVHEESQINERKYPRNSVDFKQKLRLFTFGPVHFEALQMFFKVVHYF